MMPIPENDDIRVHGVNLVNRQKKHVHAGAEGKPSTSPADTAKVPKFHIPFWKGQAYHFFGVIALAAAALIAGRGWSAISTEHVFSAVMTAAGIDWFRLGLLIPILHQSFVAIVWRLQLNHESVTKVLGKTGGIAMNMIVFFSFVAARLTVTSACAIATAGTLWERSPLSIAAAVTVGVPVFLTWHSVIRFLGPLRVAGIDHYDPAYYRKVKLVKEGAFKYLDHPIYGVATLVVSLPGIALGSLESILLGVYQYIALWILYFAIEQHDMDAIYKDS